MSDKEFQTKLAEARIRVGQFDKISGMTRDLGTILAALEAGIRNPESDAAFDVYVMLERLKTS